MVFSSVEFLFYFLPVCLATYFLSPRWLKNYILLGFSLLFYAWGEVGMVLVLFVSMAINYFVALRMMDVEPSRRRGWLIFGLSLNLGVLGVMKYADFVVGNINALVPAGVNPLLLPGIPLPIGVSFFTFHGMSYLIDVYRGDSAARTPVQPHRPLPGPFPAVDRGTDPALPPGRRRSLPPNGEARRGGARLPHLHRRARLQGPDREHARRPRRQSLRRRREQTDGGRGLAWHRQLLRSRSTSTSPATRRWRSALASSSDSRFPRELLASVYVDSPSGSSGAAGT